MKLAPQEIRTFFITSIAHGRRSILQSQSMAGLFMDVLQQNRKKDRFLLHEFVVMPDHFYLLITPAAEVPLEKAVQFIKGGRRRVEKLESELAAATDLVGRTELVLGMSS